MGDGSFPGHERRLPQEGAGVGGMVRSGSMESIPTSPVVHEPPPPKAMPAFFNSVYEATNKGPLHGFQPRMSHHSHVHSVRAQWSLIINDLKSKDFLMINE
jgi:hypothetical protein